MWEWLNIASDLLQELLRISERAALVVLLVLGIRMAGRRMCGKYRCMFWLAAAVSFLVPVSMRAEVTVPYEIVQAISEVDIAVRINEMQTEEMEPVRTMPDWQNVTAFIWMAGMCILLGVQTYRYQKTKRCLKTAVRMQENIFCTDQVDAPFLFGIVRPRIYLPLHREMKTAEYAIRHEQMHLRRGDSQIKFLVFLICMVYWWNLFAWMMYFGLANDMERACDEMVLGLEGASSVDYAQSILDAAVGRNRIGWGLTFAAGNTKKRVKNILNFKRAGNIQRVCCLSLAVLIAASSVIQIRAQEYGEAKVWEKIASGYPEFPEYLIYENKDILFREQEKVMEIFLPQTQLPADGEAFREMTAEMAFLLLEECKWVEELNVSWYEPANAELWPYDKNRTRCTLFFRQNEGERQLWEVN